MRKPGQYVALWGILCDREMVCLMRHEIEHEVCVKCVAFVTMHPSLSTAIYHYCACEMKRE